MPDEGFEKYERPTLPHERKADPGFRGGGMVGAGFEFAVIVIVFFLGGQWLDSQLETAPWLTLVLSMLGVAAAMTILIRHVIRASERKKGGE